MGSEGGVLEEEEARRRMGKGKEKEGQKTTSFLLFGCKITVVGNDNDAMKEEHAAESSSSSSRHDPSTFEIKNRKKRERKEAAEGSISRRRTDKVDNLSKPVPVAVPPAHAEGWEGALREIGARELTFICNKSLTDSDTDQQQNRLLLPKPCVGQRLLGFLTEAEKARLMNKEGIPVVAVDTEGRRWNTSFNYWKSSQSYNLNGDWRKLVQTCGLSSAHHCVEVTAFRQDDELRRLGFLVLRQDKQVERPETHLASFPAHNSA